MARWRTEAADELYARVDRLLGGKTAIELEKLGIATLSDLVRYPPRRYIAGTGMESFSTLKVDQDVAIVARVQGAEVAYGHKTRLVVRLGDDEGSFLSATFFSDKDHLIRYWSSMLVKDARGIFIGRVSSFKGNLQLAHPDFVMLDENNQMSHGKSGKRYNERQAMARQVRRNTMVGMYRANAKLPTWSIAEAISMGLDVVKMLADPLPADIVAQAEVEPLIDALVKLHEPVSQADIEAGWDRLRFDEAFATQIALAYRRLERTQASSHVIEPVSQGHVAAFDVIRPFELTHGQQTVIDEIRADLARPVPMSRLLQGDVGSGKTVVALEAMLTVIDAGHQAALLAPTEVLAKQHFKTITTMLGSLADGQLSGGIEVALLTGSMPAQKRRAVHAAIKDETAQLVIGTHALFGHEVEFGDLGLVVIDEQHRFGVEQRSTLSQKNDPSPHMLVMTATPIPRTVAMTVFGDLDVSALKQLPSGRASVKTVVVDTGVNPAWVARAWERVTEEVTCGRQAFIVCPRIDADDNFVDDDWLEPDDRSLTSVIALHKYLVEGPLSACKVGLVHGRQSVAERDQTMREFAAGDLDVLVATTVIEVGVDVPNASMMVIMDADRFGLAQLHQLRGRIGRGAHEGLCLAVAPVQEGSAQRLEAFARIQDGFELAETDLALRKEGNVVGAAQSGAHSALKALRVLEDADVIAKARSIAMQVVADDPTCRADWLADLVKAIDQQARWAERT